MKLHKLLISVFLLLSSFTAYADDAFTVNFGTEYDSTASPVFTGKLSTAFGDTKTNALAFEVAAGQKTSRTNITYGFVLDYDHYFKMTDDFLYQKRQFDFGQDLGKHNQGVYQNAFGAAYRYDIGGSLFKGVELSSYFSYAPSKKSVKKVTYEQVGEYTYIPVTSQGRLAGSKSTRNEIALQVSPFDNSLLTVGVSHDAVKFDKQWESQVSDSKFGGHVDFEQVVFPWLKARSDYRFMQLTNAYSGGFSAMLPSVKDIQLELVGDLSKEDNTAINNKYWLSKLTLKATVWGGKPNKTYTIANNKQDLREWVNKPVVRMRDVLVLSEIRYKKGEKFSTGLTPPSNDIVRSMGENPVPVEFNGALWGVLSNLGYPHNVSFKSATYYKETGKADIVIAYYDDDEDTGNKISLFYSGHKALKAMLPGKWQSRGSGNMFTCESASVSDCPFEVAAPK